MDVIRNHIGFDGLLMTDDISMQALDGSLTDRASASIKAGCDLVLHCNGDLPEMREIVEAAGEMQGKSVDRANAALAQRKDPEEFDIKAAEAELTALLPCGAVSA